MKILCITHRFPYPPDSGSKIRAFNMIRHLHAEHEVTVASIARSDREAEEGGGLAAWCARYEMAQVRAPVQVARMIASLPTAGTASSAYFHSADLARRIRRLLAAESFDLILVHSSSVAHYVAHVEGVPKILDFCDMDSQKWLAYSDFKPFPLSLGYRLEGIKLVAEEKRLARAFDVCTTATRAELETLTGYATGTTAEWFPNGVDTDYFAPTGEPYDPDVISFVGRMDYYPNESCVLDFCREAFPRIRERRPGARFLIVGADPTAAIRSLGELARRDGHGIGSRRAALPASFGGDGRAAVDRARHAEQDPRGDGGRRSGRDQQRGGRRRRRRSRASISSLPTPPPMWRRRRSS